MNHCILGGLGDGDDGEDGEERTVPYQHTTLMNQRRSTIQSKNKETTQT